MTKAEAEEEDCDAAVELFTVCALVDADAAAEDDLCTPAMIGGDNGVVDPLTSLLVEDDEDDIGGVCHVISSNTLPPEENEC